MIWKFCHCSFRFTWLTLGPITSILMDLKRILQAIAVVCKMYRGHQVVLGTGFMHMCVYFFLSQKACETQNFTPRSHKLHLVVMASLNEVIAVNLQPQSSFLLRSLIELAGMAVYFRFYSYIHTNDCCIVWQQASSTVSNDISHVALRPQLWELHVFWPELCHIWEDILGRV